MLYTLCIILILVASILIILAVLVQNPKSGMAANFGASNQVMGVRQTSDFLEKFTWTMAVVIVVLSLLATLAMDRGLVARSNVELEKDANALMEKMIVEDVYKRQSRSCGSAGGTSGFRSAACAGRCSCRISGRFIPI